MSNISSFGRLAAVAALMAICTAPALAADAPKPPGTVVELSAEAEHTAANDLARATAFVEASDNSPAELARRVNKAIAAALETAKTSANVKVRSGATHTYPTYGKGGRNIEGWRMRSEILLESRDLSALAELLGKLQATLAVGQIQLLPAPETRRKAENVAMLEAVGAFKSKADLIAGALGKPYKIRQLTIGSGARQPVYPVARGLAMAATEAAPMPLEAGESVVSVTVSGQIELGE